MLWGPEPLESERGLHYFLVREADIAIRRVAEQGAVCPFSRTGFKQGQRKTRLGKAAAGLLGRRRRWRAPAVLRVHTHTRARAHPRTHTWSLGDGERRADASVLK